MVPSDKLVESDVGEMRSLANRIAARIPEKPAPMTLTFKGRRFSTGSLFNEKFEPLVPFEPAISEPWESFVKLGIQQIDMVQESQTV